MSPFARIRKACGIKRLKRATALTEETIDEKELVSPPPLVLISDAAGDTPIVLVGSRQFESKATAIISRIEGNPLEEETTVAKILQTNLIEISAEDVTSRQEDVLDTIGSEVTTLCLRTTPSTSSDDDEAILKRQYSQSSAASIYSSESDWETSDMEILKRAFCSASPHDIIKIMKEDYSSLSDELLKKIRLGDERTNAPMDPLHYYNAGESNYCPVANEALKPRRLEDEFTEKNARVSWSFSSPTLNASFSSKTCEGKETNNAAVSGETVGFETELVSANQF